MLGSKKLSPLTHACLLIIAFAASACGAAGAGAEKPAPEKAASATVKVKGIVKVHAWRCLGETAQSTSDLLSRLIEGSDTPIGAADTDAISEALTEATDELLYGKSPASHASDRLGLLPDGSMDPEGEVSEPCKALSDDAGYGDLRDGMSVTIANADGKIIAATTAEDGHTTIRGTTWTFATRVEDSENYTFTVADRGSVTVSNEDLASKEYQASLQVGS